MKKSIIAATILAAGMALAAQPMPMMGQDRAGAVTSFMDGGSYLAAEMKAVAAELGDTELGGLTLNELEPYRARLVLAGRKDAFVARTAMLSMHLPGLGQFRTGDKLGGAGFLALHGGIVAGTLVGSYWLLPADLRFAELDYLNASHATIETRLKSHSFMDYLPSMAVMAAGFLADGGLRFWSARSAAGEARAALDSGKVKLEPLIGPGFLGMGMRF